MSSGVIDPGQFIDVKGRPDGESYSMKMADRYLLIGVILAGTWIVGVLSIPFFLISFAYMARAQSRGELTRPWAVTIIGLFCLLDAMANYNWVFELFWAHDTDTLKTLFGAYGKLVDGAYYIDYNAAWWGGVSNPGEKGLETWGTLLMYPMRIAACWGFLKMTRWGLQGMIVTSYLYLAFWLAYVVNIYYDFEARAGSALLGITGWWAVLLFYASPFVILPYLYTVNREQFVDRR